LDGGFKNWLNSNYPIEIKTHPLIPFKGKYCIDKSVLADFEYIKDKIKSNGDAVIIDCRSEAEYNGSIVRASKLGHIPQAININWINNLENEKFKEFEKLDRLYSFIPKDKEIITYCQGGYRAANTYLVLKKLGYLNVKMYLGSWGEWGNMDGLSIE
jgi:thiosulfate/3-mercaptopyruvate sulfurtransferase